MPMTEKQLLERDAKRDIGAELQPKVLKQVFKDLAEAAI
jgi:hypothetical protein